MPKPPEVTEDDHASMYFSLSKQFLTERCPIHLQIFIPCMSLSCNPCYGLSERIVYPPFRGLRKHGISFLLLSYFYCFLLEIMSGLRLRFISQEKRIQPIRSNRHSAIEKPTVSDSLCFIV